jgi:hypothetical protein
MGHEIPPEVWATIDDLQREMWAVAFHPPQDAPALGYLPSVREYIGAVPVPDATPPVVEAADPVADLVKAYRLIRDAPLGVDRPLAGPWHRFEASDVITPDDSAPEGSSAQLQAATLRLVREARDKLDEAAAEATRAGYTLCVHDGPTARIDDVRDGDFLRTDTVHLSVRIRAHMLLPGQECPHLPRTEYRGPTP